MNKVQLLVTMLEMKDVLQTQQGLIEIPSYNGSQRVALKEELFKLADVEKKEDEKRDPTYKNELKAVEEDV